MGLSKHPVLAEGATPLRPSGGTAPAAVAVEIGVSRNSFPASRFCVLGWERSWPDRGMTVRLVPEAGSSGLLCLSGHLLLIDLRRKGGRMGEVHGQLRTLSWPPSVPG